MDDSVPTNAGAGTGADSGRGPQTAVGAVGAIGAMGLTGVGAATIAAAEDARFREHLASAAELVAARRFREAEVEVLRAMSIAPTDVRGLKLLALVRFKLGRLDEARTVCRELTVALPRDAGIRLKLGLIALKLDSLDEAVDELEMAARLDPEDPRPWSYLGFAYARRGERTRAAAAFRHAGEDHHAAELELELQQQQEQQQNQQQELGHHEAPSPANAAAVPAQLAPAVGSGGHATFSGDAGSRAAVAALESAFDLPSFDLLSPVAQGAAPREPRTDPERFLGNSPGDYGAIPVAPLVGYAVSRLEPASAEAAWVGATARLPIGDEIFVRGDAAVACTGTARWEVAHQRVRGRDNGVELDHPSFGSFLRVTGRGEVFVGAPGGRLVPLLLEDDILYVREDRVLAFEGKVPWEYGHVPRGGLRMMQFRGRGLVAVRVDGEPGAVKVTPERPLFVSSPHLLGWIGRVVARGVGVGGRLGVGAGPGRGQDGAEVSPAAFGISCEGEGVVLVDVRGGGKGREHS